MPFALREMTLPPAVRHLLAALTIGLLLGFLGPFGSYPALGTIERYTFWVGLSLLGSLFVAAAVLGLNSAARFADLPGPARIAAIALASAIPMTFATAWLLSQVQPGRIVTAAGLPALYVAVASVQLILALVFGRGSDDDRPKDPAAEQTRKSRPAFAMRIPLHLGGDLIAIECQDHYLRVHTKLGSDLILCRLADALNELGEADGRRVHRSWWVADDAVVGVDREGGRSFVHLTNGLRAPVSRTYLPSVRAWRRASLPAT